MIRRNSLGLDYKNLLSPNYDDEKPSILIVSETGRGGSRPDNLEIRVGNCARINSNGEHTFLFAEEKLHPSGA